MEKNNLKSKAWYRAVLVLFFISLTVSYLIFGVLLPVMNFSNSDKIPSSTSLSNLGSQAKIQFPGSYDSVPNLELGQRIYDKRYENTTVSNFYYDNMNLVVYVYKNSLMSRLIESISWALIGFASISIIAWFISRTFFYIVTGDKFFKLR